VLFVGYLFRLGYKWWSQGRRASVTATKILAQYVGPKHWLGSPALPVRHCYSWL